MASSVPAPAGGVPRASASGAHGGSPGPGAPPRRADSRDLPRNVLSERARRRRISASCARLRDLLPRFEGRREDMASVLEMAVQFLRLAGRACAAPLTLVQGADSWPAPQLQVGLTPQGQAAAAELSVDAPRGTESAARSTPSRAGVAEAGGGPPLLPEPSCGGPRALSPRSSRDLRLSPTWSSLESEETLRSMSGGDLEDGTPFLLMTSPDWWLGSLEARGGDVTTRTLARSSPLDGAELGFLPGREHSSQGLQDGPLEPWGMATRDEADGIFADFLAY